MHDRRPGRCHQAHRRRRTSFPLRPYEAGKSKLDYAHPVIMRSSQEREPISMGVSNDFRPADCA